MAASLYRKVLVLVLVRLILLLQAVAPETCTQPDPGEHAQILHADGNKHVFQENETVQYECEAGYCYTGGDKTRKCQNGEWSVLRIRCRPRYCPYIDDPRNGLRLDSNRCAGQWTSFQCNKGYNMVGPRKLLCGTYGGWLPNTAPVCEIVHCPKVPRFANGRMVEHTTDGEQNVYGVEIEYICAEGYVRVGSERRRCEAYGLWEGAPPICDVQKCPDLGDFWNGQIVYTEEDRPVHSSAYFLCDDDSDLIPNREDLICRSISGTIAAWSDTPPKCLRKSIMAPKKHTVMSQYVRRRWTQFHAETEFMHGQQIKIACTVQHELKNSAGYVDRKAIVSTNRNGTWTPEIPDCMKLRCDLSVHPHMVFTSGSEPVTGKVDHGMEVFGRCANRYEYKFTRADSTVTRTCKKGKLYMPRCIARTCRIEEQPHAAYTDGPSAGSYLEDNVRVPTGVNVYVRCVGRSYELYSAGSYMTSFHSTCDHGDWSRNNFPVCRAKACTIAASDVYTFGDDTDDILDVGTHVAAGDVVYVNCKDLADIIGSYDDYVVLYNATCKAGELVGDYPSHCQPMTAEVNCSVDHGTVIREQFDRLHHTISCEAGYQLSVGTPMLSVGTLMFTCTQGRLEHEVSDWRNPVCEPVGCVLPDMLPHGVTVTRVDRTVLNEREEISHDSDVVVTCPKTMEPSGRRFRCHLGDWEDVDDNWDWHSNITQFPECKNATCNCENNGTCIRDAECRCGDGVTGKRCQKFVCHPDCDQNGGTCVSPNICGSCPILKYGSNCEKNGCRPPLTNATFGDADKVSYKVGDRVRFGRCAPGTALSGSREIQCLEKGDWDEIPFCLAVVEYRISVETGARQWNILFPGTDANVYIKITGVAGSTGTISLDRDNAQRKENLFEAGNTDVFVVETVDVGNITSITVSHDDANSKPDWYLQSVVVLVQSKGQQYRFSIERWLDQDTGLSVTRRPTSDEVCEWFSDSRVRKVYPKDWKKLGLLDCKGLVSIETCLRRCVTAKFVCKSVFYNVVGGYCCTLTNGYSRTLFKSATHATYLYERACEQIQY